MWRYTLVLFDFKLMIFYCAIFTPLMLATHFAQVQQGLEELSKLRAKARSVSDYTAAAALDSMHQRLSTAVALVTATMHPFSLLDSENDIMGSEAADINERIAREGTEFFTADYLFAYASGPRGHSLGMYLMIVSGTAVSFCVAFFLILSYDGNSISN